MLRHAFITVNSSRENAESLVGTDVLSTQKSDCVEDKPCCAGFTFLPLSMCIAKFIRGI